MRYFHVSKDQISDNKVYITGSELHHLVNVLRLREGNEIAILDGIGGIYNVFLTSVSQKLAIGEIKSWKQMQIPSLKLSLIQGITKADSMDMIIQKSTELGIYEIIPVICQRSVPILLNNRAEKRVNRWRQIAIESSKQSRRPFFPIIHDIIDLNSAISRFKTDLRLIFIAPSIDYIPTQSLKSLLSQNRQAKNIQIIIGPEGDFTSNEIEEAISSCAIPVSLGQNILRTETAVIAGVAIALYELNQ